MNNKEKTAPPPVIPSAEYLPYKVALKPKKKKKRKKYT
jgi:hypothetical protein